MVKKVLLVIILVMALGGLVVFLNKSNSDETSQEAIDHEIEQFTFEDLNHSIDVPSFESIAEITDINERFEAYLISAQDAQFIGDTELSLEMYKRAAATPIEDVNYYKQSLLPGKFLAETTASEEDDRLFIDIIGQDFIDEYLQAYEANSAKVSEENAE